MVKQELESLQHMTYQCEELVKRMNRERKEGATEREIEDES